MNPPPLPERERFVRYLKERGMRLTQERLVLFDEIYSHHEHIDADHLFRVMKGRGLKISRATVYRNLDLLAECGLVRKQRLGSGRFVFEHVHEGQDHNHLVCNGCGRVVEFVSPAIAALLRPLCQAHGFDAAGHQIQISVPGCARCSGDVAETRNESRVAVARGETGERRRLRPSAGSPLE